jgi:hypothetical protein
LISQALIGLFVFYCFYRDFWVVCCCFLVVRVCQVLYWKNYL